MKSQKSRFNLTRPTRKVDGVDVGENDHQYLYALVESQGASNVSDERKEFLKISADKGVCSIVVSEVKGATDTSPYAAGARSSQHVTVISPDTIYDHTRAKFYISAAWTEYVLEKYDVSSNDALNIRPLLFRELYKRERGYDAPFIPGGGNSNALVKDYALQKWARSCSASVPS